MAKNGNGNLWKWFGVLATLLGIIFAFAGLVWNASTLSSEMIANCKEDAKNHPQIRTNQLAVTELNKDMQSQQRDLSRMEKKMDAQAAAQDTIMEMQRQILNEVRR